MSSEKYVLSLNVKTYVNVKCSINRIICTVPEKMSQGHFLKLQKFLAKNKSLIYFLNFIIFFQNCIHIFAYASNIF